MPKGTSFRNYRAQSGMAEFATKTPIGAIGSLSPFQRQRVLRKTLLVIWRMLLQWDYEQRREQEKVA